jgi:hypothetical protein
MARTFKACSSCALVLGLLGVGCGGATSNEDGITPNVPAAGSTGDVAVSGAAGAVGASFGAAGVSSASGGAALSGTTDPFGNVSGGAGSGTVASAGTTSSGTFPGGVGGSVIAAAGGSPSVVAVGTGSVATASSIASGGAKISSVNTGVASGSTTSTGNTSVTAGGRVSAAGGASSVVILPVSLGGSGTLSTTVPVIGVGGAVVSTSTSTSVWIGAGGSSTWYGPIYGSDGKPLYPTGDPTPQPLPAREPGSVPSTTLADIQALQLQAGKLSCDCEYKLYGGPWGDSSYKEECPRSRYTDMGSQPPPVTDCISKALAATTAGDQRLDCERSVYAALVSCLNDVGCDQDGESACEQTYYESLNDCPRYPYDLDAKIQVECWGPPLPAPLLCADGTRLHSDLACNGTKDCANGEDESPNYCSAQSTDTKYPQEAILVCPGESGLFLSSSEMCNGRATCADGWDESVTACEAQGIQTYTCASGKVIHADWVCDGAKDCVQGEDEANCPL